MRVILGCMTFAAQTSPEAATVMTQDFVERGFSELDTARAYGNGKCEELMGPMLQEVVVAAAPERRIRVAGKANAYQKGRSLSAAGVEAQVAESLKALRREKLDILYLHAPDPNTRIEETLAKVGDLHARGLFEELGLSNYAAWEVAHIHALCREQGIVKPTVYQGMYNPITRDVERELLPCCRALGLRFYAYNPLCGGLLAAKYARDDIAKGDLNDGSRFSNEGSFAAMYRPRYLREAQLDACDIVKAACAAAAVEPAAAALRWMRHHSKLRADDGVIVGASKVDQFRQNLDALQAGPLPDQVVDAYDRAWQLVQSNGACPAYDRGTSKYGGGG